MLLCDVGAWHNLDCLHTQQQLLGQPKQLTQ
jgi:hypothetical protein